jgi:hypothetical protein
MSSLLLPPYPAVGWCAVVRFGKSLPGEPDPLPASWWIGLGAAWSTVSGGAPVPELVPAAPAERVCRAVRRHEYVQRGWTGP